ncbi:MAG: hypothetical protein C0404_14510 [Verrucomicrobia bacterium]|nr:hypothetical protein [Verrucomicrobiota bacterium]
MVKMISEERVKKVVFGLSWLLIGGIVFAGSVQLQPNAPGWLKYLLLASAVAVAWEFILRLNRLVLSKFLLGFLLCHMMLQCGHEVKMPWFTVPLSVVLFALLCACHMLAARHGMGIASSIPYSWILAAALVLAPLCFSVVMAEQAYGYGRVLAPGLAGQAVLLAAGLAVFGAYLRSRAACVVVLLMVLARLALP